MSNPPPVSSAEHHENGPSAVTLAVASWIIPGAGYWLLGDRVRGTTIGVTVLALFVLGVLVGGVRVLEVPGYGPHGQRLEVIVHRDDQGYVQETIGEDVPANWQDQGWALLLHPFDEIRNKPWVIAQVMAGPVAIAAFGGAVAASHRVTPGGLPIGVRSHARVNEIGVLYTAVAGMLNLLAIIDASHRSGHGSAQ